MWNELVSIPIAHAADPFGTSVSRVRFSPDGCLLASSGSDAWIRFWNPKTGELVDEIEACKGVVQIEWFPDSRRLLVGAHSLIGLLDRGPLKEVRRWNAHWSWVNGIGVSDDAEWFISIGLDGKLKYWGIAADAPIFESVKFDRPPQSLAWSPNRKLCAFSTGTRIRIWDVTNRVERNLLCGHTRQIWSLVFDQAGRWLASAGDDRSIRVWDPASGNERATLKGENGRICDMATSSKSNLVATADDRGAVRFWDVQAGCEVCEPVLYDNRELGLKSVTVSPDGKLTAAGGYGGTLKIWKRC